MSHGRTTGRVQKLRAKMAGHHWARPRPKEQNPYGIPAEIMQQLASENLPDRDSYSRRLNELLKEGKNG
jgi:hypothetical protein